MRREYKEAIRDYVGGLADKMCVTHYIVTVWENDQTEMCCTHQLEIARAVAKQWDGQVWEIIPNDGTTGAIAKARG